MQGELFTFSKEEIVEGLECNNCGELQPINQFQHMESGEIKRKCRTCSRNQAQLVKRLKEENPYPDEQYSCPICERTMEEIARKGQRKLQNWVLDHCHDTETFRGWVCHHCNTGLGAFKDSLDRVGKAVLYLQQHEEKKNETDT